MLPKAQVRTESPVHVLQNEMIQQANSTMKMTVRQELDHSDSQTPGSVCHVGSRTEPVSFQSFWPEAGRPGAYRSFALLFICVALDAARHVSLVFFPY